jgi:cell division transport system permease protein
VNLILRESFIAFRRSPLLSVLSVVTIAFSLFAFGLFGLVALNIREALQRIEDRVEIRAFIAEGTSVESIGALLGDAAAFPEVSTAIYVSPEEAVARAKTELAEFEDFFEDGVLPGSVDVRLKPGFRDPESVRAVAERISLYQFVDDIRFGEEWVEYLYRLRNVASVAGLTLGLAFAAVAVIIIGATIRMAVLARSREISIMRLVGATDGFIRGPFLLDGFLKGVLGGVLALAMIWFATDAINRSFLETSFFSTGTALLGILFGALIGLLGSAASVGRHLGAAS